ncbi:hypothetical protein [Rhizobium leguminosarum]|uniref:hypothetical protein n=1 Tax=Rhizobium leguminosarum TaxID=384 RepID=UPI0021B0A968|nr:hypothetical protein [Rhizobium leguminosarum]
MTSHTVISTNHPNQRTRRILSSAAHICGCCGQSKSSTSALPTSILIMLPNQRGCHHPFSIPEYSAGKAKVARVLSGNALRRFPFAAAWRLAQASYDDRATFSAEVSKDIVPKIITANGIDAATLGTEVTPGGYLLKTNASLQTEGDLDDAAADRLAGSLGYVFRQYRVLTSRLNDTTGKTGFVVVRFPQGSLNATVAQRFFEAADATKKGLGGGYAVFGDEQIFLNATNSEGKPYSVCIR